MRKTILSIGSLVILASCAAKTSVPVEANTYNTYKFIETQTAHNLKAEFDEFKANLAKIEQEKAHKRTVLSPEKKVIKTESVKIEDRTDYQVYTVTAYSNHVKSTGKHKGDKGYGITASGKHTKEGLTVSADTSKLPLGTVIYIENYGYRTVMDTGSKIKGKILDLYFESEEDCIQFGRQHLKVWIVSKPKEGE